MNRTLSRGMAYAGLLLIIVFCSAAKGGEVIMVASPDLAQNTLSSGDIKNIYLGKKVKWLDGSKITFFVLKEGDTHSDFLSAYVGKTESQFMTFWRKLVFTGRGRAPRIFSSRKALFEALKKNKGAIGYVPVGTKLDDVQKLTISNGENK